MARQRMIRPEVRTSRTVCQWRMEVRLAWIYLWMYLDNHGYGEDEVSLIKADCFPRDRDVTERKIDQWLTIMASTKADDQDDPPLCRFESRGRRYLHAVNWHQHQKLTHKGRRQYPVCPIHGVADDGDFGDHAEHDLPETVRKVSGNVTDELGKASDFRQLEKKRKEVKRTERARGAGVSDRFDEFWSVYPRKVGRADALRRWEQLVKRGEEPDAIIGAARGFASDVRNRNTEQRYIPHPATWLHQGRYMDEVEPAAPPRPVGWEFG